MRCLWACELHPFAPVGDVGEVLARRIVNVAARLLRANLAHAEQVALPGVPGGLGVYGRTGQGCFRCADTVRARHRAGPDRILYWCPGCQTRLAPAAPAAAADLPTDQHPAAKAFRADDTPWPHQRRSTNDRISRRHRGGCYSVAIASRTSIRLALIEG